MEKPLEIGEVLRDLHNISGFRISLFDKEFNELVAYPTEQSPFCKLIKENERTSTACKESDCVAFEKVSKMRTTYLHQCKFGLYDAVAPLYSFGELTGYLMMGQTIDTLSSSREYVYNTTMQFLDDKAALREAVEKIHIRGKENILSCLTIMTICAEYIALTNRLNSTTHELPKRIKQYIDQNFDSKLTIDLLSKHFFCSRATLMNAFKDKYSKTVNCYITEVRITHATELLSRTSLAIFEIAAECGYQDQNYFSKAFQKARGITPSEYRQRIVLGE